MAHKKKQDVDGQVPPIIEKVSFFSSDKVLGVIVGWFFVLSLIVVYSSSSQVAYRQDISTDSILYSHLINLLSTGFLVFVAYLIPLNFYRTMTPAAYLGSLVMTIAAYFDGNKEDMAYRTLDLVVFSFQPSEILKVATIMLIIYQLSKMKTPISKLHLFPTTLNVRRWFSDPKQLNIIFNEMLPIVGPLALACVVILPGHTSSTLILFAVAMILLYIAGIRKLEILKIIIAAIIVGTPVLLLGTRSETARTRTVTFGTSSDIDETKTGIDRYRDSFRARMAIHNGGAFGVGPGNSLMRARLIHPESDYLYAVVVEELGSFIAFIIILLYLWLFFRAIRICDGSEWDYASLLVIGLALMILMHAMVHICVTLGCIPETGQNLPFLTRGRSSLFVSGVSVGIMLGVSRQIKRGTLVSPEQKRDKNTKL